MLKMIKAWLTNRAEARYLRTMLEIKTRNMRLKPDAQREALRMLASDPVYTYLLAWMDELMRHGVYLERKYTSENVRFVVEQLSDILGQAKEQESKELVEPKNKRD